MLLPAKCPECGGLIEVNSEMKAANCKFCASAFIVEEAVNNFNTYFNVTHIYNTSHNYSDGAVVNVYEDKTKDFVIEGGVLKKYQGESVDVIIPDGVVEIGRDCFDGLKIKSVVIPDSVTSIGESAFYKCTNLASVKIPDGVTKIGNYTFMGCTSLTSVIIPKNVTTIGSDAFQDCTNLVSVTIFNSEAKIEWRAFGGCTNLTTVIIDDETKINEYAFECTPVLAQKEEKERVERERTVAEWKRKGLCANCGGEFKGFFTLKCSKCGCMKQYQ